MTLQTLLALIIGGILGTLSRFGLSVLIKAQWPSEQAARLATLSANLLGAALAGYILARLSATGAQDSNWRHLLLTGFMGALTTFSTLCLELLDLWQKGQTSQALCYLAITVVAGLLLCWCGYQIGR